MSMANRPADPDITRYVAVGRLLVALIAVLAVAAGTNLEDDVPHDGLVVEATRLRDTTERLSERLGASPSPDLAMAWEDLHSDLLSVAGDLERPTPSMDLDGLILRVESFREQHDLDNESVEWWDELVQVLRVLVGRDSNQPG